MCADSADQLRDEDKMARASGEVMGLEGPALAGRTTRAALAMIVCVACGRVGFEAMVGDGPSAGEAVSDGAPVAIVYVAPDTNLATISVAWTGSNCNDSKNHVGDEFAMIELHPLRLTAQKASWLA
jgi:hypothetical protein